MTTVKNREPSHHTREGVSNRVLEVPYQHGHVRVVINDTLPWTHKEALTFHSWSNEEIITLHLEAIERKIDDCIVVAKSPPFQQRHPNTTLEKVRIVLRFRNLPIPSASGFMVLMEQRVKNEGMQFIYGYGGDAF